MKLKCIYVNDLSGTFTKGKMYEAVPSEEEDFRDLYKVTNDRGWVSSVPLDGNLWGFEIVEDSSNDQQESEDLQTELPSLEQLSEWCQKAEVDITLTSFGTFNVFDGDTERQCEIDDAENLVQLLQIMSSYKESLESFGRWV